jgi:apoptosis-inducing factor 3
MSEKHETSGPDLTKGIAANAVADGKPLLGRVGDNDVMLVHAGDEYFAVGASCTHYHGALVDGLVVDETVRCPLHHACFSLRTGEALRAPALDPVSCWRVERQNDSVFVREQLPAPRRSLPPSTAHQQMPSSVGIIGGGAAGLAAADMLRREGYEGPVSIISADQDPPVDRPNLSKDYLAGEAQEEWIPLWPIELYSDRHIELVLNCRVTSLDPVSRSILLDDGSQRGFGALLIATGADPVRLPIPGADGPQVRYLRTYADARAIVERATHAKHAVVVGASFIGLEVSASLRARGVGVEVVAPEQAPLERVLGIEVGRFVQSLHEAQGVVFHLGQTVTSVSEGNVALSGGETLNADLVVIGVGVSPATSLAEKAGLALDRGISVDEYLETSAHGVFAAGDVARWPDPHTGDRIRVEHWVVAERQGQVAARNILGRRERFEAVPFFWSQHYDVTIRYVGHAERWDAVSVDGALEGRNCAVKYTRAGRTLAVATISRDRENLAAEVKLESATAS